MKKNLIFYSVSLDTLKGDQHPPVLITTSELLLAIFFTAAWITWHIPQSIFNLLLGLSSI